MSSQSSSFGMLDALREVYSRDDDEVTSKSPEEAEDSEEETEEEREMRLIGTLVPTEELLRSLGIYRHLDHDDHDDHDETDDSSSKEVVIQKKKRSPRRPRQNFSCKILGDNDMVKRELKQVMEEEGEKDYYNDEKNRKRNAKTHVMEEEAEEDYYDHVEKSRKRKRNTKEKSRSRKISRKTDLTNYIVPEPAPPLPDNVRAIMEEDGPVEGEPSLVLQRILNDTDLSSGHNRLAIPITQILNKDFLTEDEKSFLREKKPVDVVKKSNSKKKKYKTGSIHTRVISPSLNIDDITLKCWEMKKTKVYALNKTWNALVDGEAKNGKQLLPGMVLQIWAYRVGGLIRFALVNLGTFLKEAESPLRFRLLLPKTPALI